MGFERGVEACSFCGGLDLQLIYDDCRDRLHWVSGRFAVAGCAGCGLVQTVPRPSRADIGRYYPSDYVSFADAGGSRSRLRRLLREVVRVPYRLRYGPTPLLPSPGRVLDVGCGAGNFLAELAELGWEPWGVEPSAQAASRAARRLNVPEERIAVYPAEEAEFPGESFDLIVMSHVLEHLHDPAGVLDAVGRWLRPGGLLLVRVPNFEAAERRIFGRQWMGLDVPRHLHHFTQLTLTRMLERAGLRVEDVRPQFQATSLSGSLTHLGHTLTRRRVAYRHSRALYYAVLPLASVALALGNAGALEVRARKR